MKWPNLAPDNDSSECAKCFSHKHKLNINLELTWHLTHTQNDATPTASKKKNQDNDLNNERLRSDRNLGVSCAFLSNLWLSLDKL